MYMELEVQYKHVCMIKTNADFIFQKLIANNYRRLQCSRIHICPSCIVYALSNMYDILSHR